MKPVDRAIQRAKVECPFLGHVVKPHETAIMNWCTLDYAGPQSEHPATFTDSCDPGDMAKCPMLAAKHQHTP